MLGSVDYCVSGRVEKHRKKKKSLQLYDIPIQTSDTRGDESGRLIVHWVFFFWPDITIEKRANTRFSHLPAEFGFHIRARITVYTKQQCNLTIIYIVWVTVVVVIYTEPGRRVHTFCISHSHTHTQS